MGIRLVIRSLAALTLVCAYVTSAPAQVPGGAFERLAPGEQKIARSLFAAQRRDVPPGSRLTLDQIAAKKSGEGWGGVFKDMKSQGLVTAKNLGQVVKQGAGRPQTAAKGVVIDANRGHGDAAASASVRGHSDDGPRGAGASIGGGLNHGGGRGK
jgi:hypothetical protein